MAAQSALLQRWSERRRRKAAIRELRAVDDRTLRDMGLTRGEIVAAVQGEVYRGEPIRSAEPEPPVATVEPAELQRHIERARQVRAVYLLSLCASAFGALRRLRRNLLCRWLRPGGAAAAAGCAAARSADRAKP